MDFDKRLFSISVLRYTFFMDYGFLRVAAVSPHLTVADCTANADEIIKNCFECAKNGAKLIVFPELCITGYTCGDLFLQRTLQKSAQQELFRIARATKDVSSIIIVGLPLATSSALNNVAAILCRGEIIGIVPKTYIPNYSEFYEARYFQGAIDGNSVISLSDDFSEIPFSQRLIVLDSENRDFGLAVELCEDVWTPLPPSTLHALSGVSVIANLSASNEVIGKAQYRRALISTHSAQTMSAYIYANAGKDESTTDVVFSGHSMIAENGKILAESVPFECGVIIADVDLELLAQERRKNTSYADCMKKIASSDYQIAYVSLFGTKNTTGFGSEIPEKNAPAEILRPIAPSPFVPSDKSARAVRCREVIELQSEGLAKRLRHIKAKTAVLGLSGGLDSTLALLVTCRAFDKCALERSGIVAVTMPCFGTTNRTYKNACTLAKESGASLREIPIKKAVLRHFADIGHDEKNHNITYENAQARERTQVLMDIANMVGGIVIGTGDLSELALGWCTYNADQMSMYGVNSSIPKTLVRYLVGWFADDAETKNKTRLSRVLRDILDTPVSPELLPPTRDGKIAQKTEDLVGPYELHDFYLYYVLRYGFGPKKIFALAKQAFAGTYADDIIKKWLVSFYKRFFSQQFKRSCMPDGAKVGTVSLSPRGDWRMPSDASAAVWIAEAEEI